MMKTSKGTVFIISGPSGSGKTTLYRKLLKDKNLKDILVKSISFTTRSMRENEKDGRDYCFISLKMFQYKKRSGYFLESMKVFDNYYGTAKKSIEDILRQGKNVILCIDVKGAKVISGKLKNVVKIFVKTPEVKDLKERLLKRGTEDENLVRMRLKVAREELKDQKFYEYVIVNDKFPKAYQDVKDIVEKHI